MRNLLLYIKCFSVYHSLGYCMHGRLSSMNDLAALLMNVINNVLQNQLNAIY